jgi:hypothetical protein
MASAAKTAACCLRRDKKPETRDMEKADESPA